MWTGPSSKCDIFDVGRIDEHSSMLVLSIILIRLDSALVSFTPGQVISFRTRCPSSRFCFSTVSVRLSSLKRRLPPSGRPAAVFGSTGEPEP